MIENGCDMNIKDNEDDNLEGLACYSKVLDLINLNLLFNKGLNINQ